MESRGSPAAAPDLRSAAALGSRSSRRQVKFVLAAAAEAGAYSVSFSAGQVSFTVYLAGDFAGAGTGIKGAAAATRAAPPSSRVASTTTSAQPGARAPAATAAPAQPAAARRRGCRAGAKEQRRRHGGGRAQLKTPDAPSTAPQEGDAAALAPSEAPQAGGAAAPPAPPPLPSIATPTHSFSLSPHALPYAPPPPPSSLPSSSLSSKEGDPSSVPPDPRQPLTHGRRSWEDSERRWEHHRPCGASLNARSSSQKKRPEPPSPPWPPSSAIVGCVVNERRVRVAPPFPSTPFLPPSRTQ